MILNTVNLRVIEAQARRILGAIRCVDAVTGLPVRTPGAIRMLGAELERPGANVPVPASVTDVRIGVNRSGYHVILRAPFFDSYTAEFEDPEEPDETDDGPLRLFFAVSEPGRNYLPQSFSVELPRTIDPEVSPSVFEPVDVGLLRSVAAPMQHGWAVLRVRVVEEGSDPERPLPGVLLRVFRHPRSADDEPIGVGMTEWRGRLRGEAVVPIAGVERFRPADGNGAPGGGPPGGGPPGGGPPGGGPPGGGPPGGGPPGGGPPGGSVIETTLSVTVEAARLTDFTGGEEDYPDVGRLLAAIPDDLDADPPAGTVLRRVALSTTVRAGREASVRITMA